MAYGTIVLAGATGNLGARIERALHARGADVRALVRPSTSRPAVDALARRGVEVLVVDFGDARALADACTDAVCVVSALAGLREVIVDAQSALLDAAVRAGVPRFVPSDFSIDFTKLPPGRNRNLDLRREFQARLERAPIAATSILCGAFADMLTGQAPFVLPRVRRVLYWENADQRLDFTTMDDTAAYTAAAALDPSAPRFLRIAGDSITARALADTATAVSGQTYRLLRGGSLARLDRLITIARALQPARGELYPAWQGMQYMRDMYSGLGVLEPLDRDRYADLRWTRVRDVLAAHLAPRLAPPAPEPRPTYE